MSASVKTIATWVLILVAAIGFWNFVEKPASPRTISLTDFVDKVGNGSVAEVTITGSTITGRTRPDNQPFMSTMLPGYTALYDQLIKARVKVTVLPEDQYAGVTSLMSWFLPLLVAFGFGWLCASWYQRQRPQPPMTIA